MASFDLGAINTCPNRPFGVCESELFGERPLWEVGFDGMPPRNGASPGCHYQVRHNRKDVIRGNLEPFIPLLPLPSLFSFHGRDWDGQNGSHERIELSGSSPPSPRYPTAARSIRLPTPGQSPATARSPTPARAPRAPPRPPGQASPSSDAVTFPMECRWSNLVL